MHLWTTSINVLRPLPSFPQTYTVASERQFDTGYRHEGRNRIREHHSIFKITLSGEGIFRDAQGEHRLPPGRGFLCTINDPETAYYYPADAREPWEFVYIGYGHGPATDMTRELVERHGAI